MSSQISVAILSSDLILVEALESVLAGEGELDVVRVRDGLQEGPSQPVDVVLVDASSNRETALAQIWNAQEWPGPAQRIVLGLEREDESVIDFIQAGATGYVLKNASSGTLIQAIRTVHSGQAVCSPRIAAAVFARISWLASEESQDGEQSGERLTARELDILTLMAQGLCNKEIGRNLGITVQTVKNHVHSILDKLGVHRRREAVRIAYERGLLPEPESLLDPAVHCALKRGSLG